MKCARSTRWGGPDADGPGVQAHPRTTHTDATYGQHHCKPPIHAFSMSLSVYDWLMLSEMAFLRPVEVSAATLTHMPCGCRLLTPFLVLSRRSDFAIFNILWLSLSLVSTTALYCTT